MNNFIEEFYYGNIDPQSQNLQTNQHFQSAMGLLSENEELLSKQLTGEEQKLFLSYASAWSEVNGESNLNNFIVGFHLGARFAYDTFANQ